MKYRFNIRGKGFSLVETSAALIILSIISLSVLTVINRSMASAADSILQMRAFEVARENMEKLLALDSVEEMTEYGQSEKYHEVKWQTSVESFYEPITSQMWIQAVCTAEYVDSEGQEESVELTHWLTNLTKEDLFKMIELKKQAILAASADPTDPTDPDPDPDPTDPDPDPDPTDPDPDHPDPDPDPEPEVDDCEPVGCGLTLCDLMELYRNPATRDKVWEFLWTCDEI